MSAAAVLPVLNCDVAIVGAGPAGLMAAQLLSAQGAKVHVFDGKASVGRKFLLAGVGGMNITHSEAYPAFLSRYAERAPQMAPLHFELIGAAVVLDFRVVHENVLAAVVRLDKPEPLLGKEELHGTLCHIWSFLCSLGRRDTKPIGNVERTASRSPYLATR